VTYLLDVNALISLVHREHAFHRRVANWLAALEPLGDRAVTCSIVELGVIRVLPQLPDADYSVEEAQHLLALVKAAYQPNLTLLSDDLGADQLPKWVKNPGQTTDGHLVLLAKANGATLATMNRKIHGAFLIPA
jgi:predicted nucleic acid-binding protein